MKILSVIVDELPDNCNEGCEKSDFCAGSCDLKPHSEGRNPDCPLVTMPSDAEIKAFFSLNTDNEKSQIISWLKDKLNIK